MFRQSIKYYSHLLRQSTQRFFTNNARLGTLALAATMPMPNPASIGGDPLNQKRPQLTQSQSMNPFGQISWNDFCFKMLARGEVEKVIVRPGTNRVEIVLHEGAIIDGRRVFLRHYFMQVPNIDSFEMKMRDFEQSLGIKTTDSIPIIYERNNGFGLSALLFLVIGSYLLVELFGKKGKISMGGANIFSSMKKAKFTLVDPLTRAADATTIKFKDVAGLQEAKVEVMEFVDYLKNSEKFLKLGAKLPKGVLLTGPPGCGKTLLAKAVATEANVPFMALAGSDFVEMIGGLGAARVRSLFKTARKLSPCIIYIDEIDSIGKKRSSDSYGNREMEQTLNQLLIEMDGMVSRAGIILLASTNRAEVLDKALTRAGRFDRQILIDMPNLAERKEIFERHSSKIKLDKDSSEYSARIAQLTVGMNGADIANICNEAALHAARKDKSIVTIDDIEYAIEKVVGGTEKRSSLITDSEKRIIAYHECGHALVSWLLKHAQPLIKVSIVPRERGIGGYARYLPSDQKLYSKEEFFDMMCMAMGGKVAEMLKFNHVSTGAQNDLQKITKIAMDQIKQYGFDEAVGHISFPEEEPGYAKPYSKKMAALIDHRASLLVAQAFKATQDIIAANMDKLDLLAEALLKNEVMNASDVEALIGPRPYPTKLSRV